MRKIKNGFKLLISNPIQLLYLMKIEGRRLYIRSRYGGTISVVNNGERFDPLLTTGYEDFSHLPRYRFAQQLVNIDNSVLDIACGTGYGTEILSKSCRKIDGVDISVDAIEYAKNNRKGNNLEYHVNDLYLNHIKADVIVSFETIEHIPDKSIEETIGKLLEYSNKLVIGSFPYNEKPGSNEYHFHFNIDEKVLAKYQSKYIVEIFYQDFKGVISKNKSENIQNLIFKILK